jgi:hypothetical protein
VTQSSVPWSSLINNPGQPTPSKAEVEAGTAELQTPIVTPLAPSGYNTPHSPGYFVVFGGGSGIQILAGQGVPPNTIGNSGDFYFRMDAPAANNQRIYNKQAGAWTGIV